MRTLFFVLVFGTNFVSTCLSQDIKGTYAIKNVKTGMLLRVKDASSKNGTPLVAYYPQNWKCMTWDFKTTGPNTYQLENLLTHKTFQAKSAGTTEGFEEQPLVSGNAGQQYEFIQIKKDTFLIKIKGSDLYITPSDVNGGVNSLIIMAEKRNSSEQEWTIYQQSPTM